MNDASGDAPRRASFNPLIRPYLVFYGAMVLVMTIVGIPLALIWVLGVGQWWARHYFALLECELGPTSLRFRKGILLRIEKTIPLENIQDVTFIEGPLLKHFNLSVLRFETAGHGHGQANAMSLVGIIDAQAFRAEILARREAARRRGQAAHVPVDAGEQVELLRAILARVEEIAARTRAP